MRSFYPTCSTTTSKKTLLLSSNLCFHWGGANEVLDQSLLDTQFESSRKRNERYQTLDG